MRACVGREDELGAFKHEDAGAFGELPVEADHDADLDRTGLRFERACPEAVSWTQVPLGGEVACVDLCILQDDASCPVDEEGRVARAFVSGLEQCREDGDLVPPGQGAEAFDVGRVECECSAQPDFRLLFADVVAHVPHLGKEEDVRTLPCGLGADALHRRGGLKLGEGEGGHFRSP